MKLEDVITAENCREISEFLNAFLRGIPEKWYANKRDPFVAAMRRRIAEATSLAALKELEIEPVPKHISDYLKIGGVRCPYPDCNTLDISGGGVDITEYGAEQSVVCIECSRTWTDHYKLVGVTLDEPAEDGV